MSINVSPRYSGLRTSKSPRLLNYDYSQPGYYFVTISIHRNASFTFGTITPSAGAGSKPAPQLNEYGEIVKATWHDLPNHIQCIELDEFIVMPDHVHGIIRIVGEAIRPSIQSVGAGFKPAPSLIRADGNDESGRAGFKPAPTHAIGLPEIVRQFKTFSARRINAMLGTPGIPVWHRSYHDRIIRCEKTLYIIRKYIRNNPIKWA